MYCKAGEVITYSRSLELEFEKGHLCGDLRDCKQNILGNPRGYARRIELEFVENLKFLAFSTIKNTKEENKHITKNKPGFFFWGGGLLKYRVGRSDPCLETLIWCGLVYQLNTKPIS